MEVVIDPKTNVYKRFIGGLRFKDLKVAYITIRDNYPKLKSYIRKLRDVEFNEEKAHTMFGNVKRIVSSFIEYYNTTMNDVIKITEDYKHIITKPDLVELMQLTIDRETLNQIEFSKEFLPVDSEEDQELYIKIQERYDKTMEGLIKMEAEVMRLDKQFKVEKFLEENLPVSIQRQNKVLRYTHKFMSLMLAGRLKDINMGVEEILLRVCNNLKDIRFQCEGAVNDLLHHLYDKNKEWIHLQRKSREMTVDTYEVERTIDAIRWKIKHQDPTVCDLDKEVEYWTKISGQIDKIANTLSTLRSESRNIERQYEFIQSGQSDLTPEKCQAAIKKINLRRNMLYTQTVNISKALFSLYQTRGSNNVIFQDEQGVYHIDEYDHQVYHYSNHYRTAHVDCKGNLRVDKEAEKYYFDDNGRFIYDTDGEKIYKIASCTSMYKLDGTTKFFTKITKDCGHSEHLEKLCRMNPKSLYDKVILPDVEPIDCKGTLDKETVSYLLSSFAYILPFCLAEVARIQPKNPIHSLAHQLLRHKYRMTTTHLATNKKTAETYLSKKQQLLKEKIKKEVDSWRAKNLVDRRRYDDAEQNQNFLISHGNEELMQLLVDYTLRC